MKKIMTTAALGLALLCGANSAKACNYGCTTDEAQKHPGACCYIPSASAPQPAAPAKSAKTKK